LEWIVLQIDPDRDTARKPVRDGFILYVEGPRDREILRAWAYRLQPALAGRIIADTVILGGRQPQRAVAHFRDRGGAESGHRGLCLLDRDDGAADTPSREGEGEDGLEFFTWSRRHIESYLLVPDALRRALCLRESDSQIGRILARHLPSAEDESAFRKVDAKRLLGRNGILPRALGRPVPLSGVARATRENELHSDVHELFGRLHGLLTVPEPGFGVR
jgi:hypothetical protein